MPIEFTSRALRELLLAREEVVGGFAIELRLHVGGELSALPGTFGGPRRTAASGTAR